MAHLPVLVLPVAGWDVDDSFISDELVGRLYRADEKAIGAVAKELSSPQRASLAVFCYGRSHLHGIGLSIAATCDLTTLTQALGTAVGQVIFNQSRQRAVAVDCPPAGRRHNKITLATIPSGHRAARRIVEADPVLAAGA